MQHEPMPGLLWVFLFWGMLVGAPLCAVGLSVPLMMQQQVADFASMPTSGARAAYEGLLGRSSAPLRTPLGAKVAGWSGAVKSTTRSGKSSYTRTLCTLGDTDDMTFDGAPLLLPQPVTVDNAFDLLSGSRVAGLTPVLLGEVTESESIPAEAASRCPMPPAGENEKRSWVEHRFPMEATVTFAGCRDARGFVPCATPLGGHGQLAVGTRRELVARMLASSLLTACGITLVSIFFSIVAGGYVRARFKGWRP